MSRIVVIGLAGLVLTACGPANQAPTAEPAASTSVPASAPSAPVISPEHSAPMTWEAMQDHYRPMEVEPNDPLEALEYRAVICAHLSSEIGSGVLEREQYLNAQIDKYRCGDGLAAEVRALRDASSANPAAMSRLATILANLN